MDFQKIWSKVFLSILSLLAGVGLALVVFFGLWGLVSFFLDYAAGPKPGLIHEIAWTLCNSIPFFVAARITRYLFHKRKIRESLLLTLPLCVPAVVGLYLLAGIGDAPHKEYIPRIVWVIAPFLAYTMGLIPSLKSPIGSRMGGRSNNRGSGSPFRKGD